MSQVQIMCGASPASMWELAMKMFEKEKSELCFLKKSLWSQYDQILISTEY